MLTYAEIRDILVSLDHHYRGRNPKFDKEFIDNSKWVIRDVNREVVKKIKKKYGGNQS